MTARARAIGVAQCAGARIARVVAYAGGQLRVEVDGVTVAARVATAVSDEAAAHAARDGAEAVVVFEQGDAARPIVLALLHPVSRAPVLVREEAFVRVDGREVIIEGRDEVVLRCGKASLTLSRDGRVVLRGVNVVSQADEVHKVRGGKVQIN